MIRDCQCKPWLGDKKTHAARNYSGIYNVDAVAYESVLIGLSTIFRCKGWIQGGAEGCLHEYAPESPRNEHDSVTASFSRDGFHFSRYPPATEGYVTPSHGTNLSAGHIVPFAPLAAQNASNVSWNYAMLQSVGGGFLVGDFSDDESDDGAHEQLLFFFGADANDNASLVHEDQHVGVVAPGHVLTHPITFRNSSRELFVNLKGTATVEIVDVATNHSIAPFSATNCVISNSTELAPVDSTKARVQWEGAGSGLSPLFARKGFAETGVRLRFTLAPCTQLYAFWVSDNEAGHSGGFVAGGGPKYSGSRDAAVQYIKT
eukprot:g540.t1